ncbi:MAG: hypothetical protein ACJ8C4_15525 [Gemmataceae bacterium]
MTLVESFEYDNGDVGDGNLTSDTQHPGGDGDDRVTQYSYDWRNRPVVAESGAQDDESLTLDTNRPLYYAEAHNTGAITRYLANGIQFAEVIEQRSAPEQICDFVSGQILSLRDHRLTPAYHPNSNGGIKPVLGEPVDPIMSPDDPRIPADERLMVLKRVRGFNAEEKGHQGSRRICANP